MKLIDLQIILLLIPIKDVRISINRNRRQCVLFDGRSGMFPCQYLKRSETKPKSVHKLQPGDIDVVAAIGDSITAGTGALGRNIFQLRNEYRGVSFSIGGKETWQKYTTLPNIMKNFNPNLYGMSFETTQAYKNTVDQYNIAISGSKTFNVTDQAYFIIGKMKDDVKIDFNSDWKMVTILIGHNDLCSIVCMKDEFDADMEVEYVKQTLDVLYYGSPRTFVNLMPIADISQLFDLQRLPTVCALLRMYLCPCLFSPFQKNRFDKQKSRAWIKMFNQKLEDLVASGRYDHKKDFSVVIQPSLMHGSLPMKNEIPDLDFLAPDCFHWGQRTHALVSRGLWNNLIQPVGQKSESYDLINQPFLCPSPESPYLATSANSRNINRNSSKSKSTSKDYLSMMRTKKAKNSSCQF